MEKMNAFYHDVIYAGYELKQNQSIKEYVSLRLGGIVKYVCEPSTIQEIMFVIDCAKEHRIPFCILGNGSNVLFPDEGYEGVVLVLARNFIKLELEHGVNIRAQGGADLKLACLFALDHSLKGMEFAYGIPATCGGGAYMNAGAYGGELKDIIDTVTYLDEYGNIHTLQNKEMDFRYRHSVFSDRSVCVLEVVFALEKGEQADIYEKMDTFMKKRIDKQPLEYPSAGSTFKRPVGNYASALIAQCGLKGMHVGDAMVSTKHAGFLINTGEATSTDFLTLIEEVRAIVYVKTGYYLECEIKIISKDGRKEDTQ